MPVTMYDLHAGGKANIWGWIVLILTIIFLLVSIYQLLLAIQNLRKDSNQDIRLSELEKNVESLKSNQRLFIR